MYPNYTTNGNNTTPLSYPLDQTLPYPHQEDQYPSPSSLFYNFPSPSIHYEDDILLRQHLHDLMLHQAPQPAEEAAPPEMADPIENGVSESKTKRTSKKDRHSKIETAQGPRDRRMRLSLEVAPQFFGLQDMLGFDKASKTVGWLLMKSKNAIKDLKKGIDPHMTRSSSSSTSEGEVVSGNEESSSRQARKISTRGKGSISVAKEKKVRALLRKSAFDPLAKESREKARARARERTREKIRLNNEPQILLPNSEAMNHGMNQFGSWNPFENREESGSQSLNINPSLEVEELSSPIIFNYDQHNSTGISQEHQFTDFQAYGKPWEAYNSMNPF